MFALMFPSAALLPRFAAAQTPSAFETDGDGWIAASESLKLGCLLGFTDAASDAHTVTGGNSSICHPANGQDQKLLTISQENFDYTNIKYKQHSDGMDSFYSDYANRAIRWDRAISYVRDTIHGKSKDALERELTFERKWALSDTNKK